MVSATGAAAAPGYKNTPPVHNSQPNRTKCSPKRFKFSSWFTSKSSTYLVIKSTTGMRSQFEENRSSRAGDKPPRCPLPCAKPLRIFRSQSTWHVRIVYLGISSHVGPQSRPRWSTPHVTDPDFQAPVVLYLGIPSQKGPQSRPRSWTPNPRDGSRLRDLISYRTSIETLFVDSESTRQVRIGYLGIFITYGTSIETSLVDFQSTWQVPIVYLGISSLWDLVGGWTLHSKIHHLFKQFR